MSKEEKPQLPKKTFTAEFFVGLFAIVGLCCFGYLAVTLAGMKLLNAGYYEVTAEFDSVAGLKLGAPVEIAGVRVGEVASLSLNGTSAEVKMQLRDGIVLRDDDIAAIRTKGIIGDRYIKISPGGSEDAIEPGGSIIDTESAVEFEEIIGKLIHRME